MYLAITNDYPGNTKAVNSVHYAYKGVRTDSSCEICDKYLVVDDDEAASWIYILGIWLILV